MSLQDNLIVQDKQPTQYPLTPKHEGFSKITERAKVRASRYLDASSTKKVTQVLIKHWRTLAGLVWRRKFEEVFLKHKWRKSTHLGMSLCPLKNTTTYSCPYMWTTSRWWERMGIKIVRMPSCSTSRTQARRSVGVGCAVLTPHVRKGST